MNTESENVLKALSSHTRRTIMRQISAKGSANYTEIMQVLGLDPSLMSGTFNYHLKELNNSGLIERQNGEYRITDLGKKALVLVDQVSKDSKIDQYGVLSAVMSMNPRKELTLFLSQLGMMMGFVSSALSLIFFLVTYGTGSIDMWISFFMLAISSIGGVLAFAKFYVILSEYNMGFSGILFLSSGWFLIRSPNRNNFFVLFLTLMVTMISSIICLLLSYIGELPVFSTEWLFLAIVSVVFGSLTIVIVRRARNKALQLEEENLESI